MAKLRGAAKEEFLKRMAKGRRKAAKKNGKKKARKNVTRRPAKRANAGPRSVRKSKKAMKKLLPGFRRKKRRNQEESMQAAAEKFTEFHGKPPNRIIEYEIDDTHYPDKFAEMGRLKELRFDLDTANRDFPLRGFGACQAVCTPDGRNIYFLGGDQSVSLDDLNIASDKDIIELGPCTFIEYHTVKGFHDFEPTDYWHRFGETNHIQPVLAYDRLNRSLFLIGGDYEVRPEGIVN